MVERRQLNVVAVVAAAAAAAAVAECGNVVASYSNGGQTLPNSDALSRHFGLFHRFGNAADGSSNSNRLEFELQSAAGFFHVSKWGWGGEESWKHPTFQMFKSISM